MLKVEIRHKNKNSKDKYVVVNDVEDIDSYYSDRNYPSVYLYNEDVENILTSHSFKEVGEYFSEISFSYDFDWWESTIRFEVFCNQSLSNKYPSIRINLQIDEWEHWAKPWSIASLVKQFETNVVRLNNMALKSICKKDVAILDFKSSKAYNDKRASFAWGLWHDPDINKKGCSKDKKKAIEGYQRFIDILPKDYKQYNWYGIKSLSAFQSIKGANSSVDVKKAAELRLKELKK